MRIWPALGVLSLGFLSGCSRNPASWPAARADFDGWRLTTHSPYGHLGSYLANGFLGLRLGPLGMGQGSEGTRFVGLAGLYDREAIVRLPDWNRTDLFNGRRWFSEGSAPPAPPIPPREVRHPPRPDIRDYSQTLDLRRGILTTRFTWTADRRPIHLQSELFLSRVRPGIAVNRLTLHTDSEGPLRVRFSLDPSHSSGEVLEAKQQLAFGGSRPSAYLLVRVHHGHQSRYIAEEMGVSWPPGSPVQPLDPTASLGGRWGGASCTVEVRPAPGRPATLERLVSVAVGPTSPLERAHAELEGARRAGFERLLEEHVRAWERLWESDMEIDGDAESQRVVRTALFHLYASARPGSRWSLPPMGLSSPAYQGHIFWDAEMWIYPVLLLLQPEMARSLLDYRLDRLPAARRQARRQGYPGADFPWESAATGEEVAPSEFAQERHITADVAWAFWQYYQATGDRSWLARQAWPVLRDTADFWAARAVWNEEEKRYEIRGVLTPDETAGVVNNSAWTNAMAHANLQIASQAAPILDRPVPRRWQEVAQKLWIPFDAASQRFLEHDRYRGQPTKQADTELLIFPRRLPMSPEVQRATFDYYANRTSPFGPAMTSSLHALIAAQLGRREQAWQCFQASYQPFLRPAFDLFSEKRTTDAVYFLTGAAGLLQSILYGFAGLYPDGTHLQARPCLPPPWKKLTIRGLHWRGQRFQLTATAARPLDQAEIRPLGTGPL